MAKEEKIVEVKGTKFKFMPLGGESGAEVMERIGLGALTDKLSSADLSWVRKKFAANTKVGIVDEAGDGRINYVAFSDLPGGFDDFFRGRLSDILEWEKAAVEVSFGDFLDVLKGIARAQKAVFASSSQPTSTGTSGESSPANGSTSEAPAS